MKERFIELLEQDAAQARIAAQHWKALGEVRVEDLEGNPVATAADMVAKYAAKEMEIRELIASIKALP